MMWMPRPCDEATGLTIQMPRTLAHSFANLVWIQVHTGTVCRQGKQRPGERGGVTPLDNERTYGGEAAAGRGEERENGGFFLVCWLQAKATEHEQSNLV